MLSDSRDVQAFDDYGFAIFSENSLHRSEDQRCHEYHITEESDSDVLSSQTIWTKLETNFDQKRSPQKLRNFIKNGIPATLRGDFWQLLVGSRNLKNNTTFDYKEKLNEVRNIMVDCGVTEYGGVRTAMVISKLIGQGSFDDEVDMFHMKTKKIDDEIQMKLTSFRQILLDAERSFPTHVMFMDGTAKGKEGRAALFRILAVYVLYNPLVSYCQGMSYIAGMLLMNMNEEDAFWMLVSLFERPKYLSGYFDSSLSKVHRHSQVFERFLRQKMPKLYTHLKSNGIDPLLYITPWFMALFTSLPCWDSVLTIWDLLLLDGISVIFQASLAILNVLSDNLLAVNDMSLMLPMLLRVPSQRIKRQVFIPVMWRWTIYSWEVDAVLAIINDSNNIDKSKPENKRKILHNDNGPAKKVPRLVKENYLSTLGQRNPTSLFQKFTKFVMNFLPNSLKENTASGLIINSPTVVRGEERRTRRSSSCEPFTASTSTTSKKRVSQRKRRHHHTGNEDTQMFQKLRIASPLRQSPRIAKLQSESMSLNTPSTTEVVSMSSPNAKHAFKMFNTPTPIRISQISKTPKLLGAATPPHFSLSPDVELQNFQKIS